MDLHSYLARRPPDYRDTAALGHCLRALVEAGLDQLPLPGSGRTLDLSDFPSEMLSAIDVHKTASAEQLEGGLGGSIDLINRETHGQVLGLDATVRLPLAST